jgi:tetratricopeptide (TPR) repeat protein
MKVGQFFIEFLLFGTFIIGCAHQEQTKKSPKLSEFSSEQIEQLNREALALASERLGELVIQAKTNESTMNYLAGDLFLKGNMSLLEGDYATASVLFRHLSMLVPQDTFVQKKYAISLIREGDLESAVKVIEKLYTSSKDEKIGLILAGVYTGLEKEMEARKIYRSLISQNPKNEDACIFLGKSLAVAKRAQEAISQLKNCALKNRKSGMYDYYAGKIYLDMGQVPAAISSFKMAYTKQADLGQAISALGLVLEEREKHDEAIKIYEKYLTKQKNDIQILTRIVQVLFLKERFTEVIPYAERLSDLEPENLNLKVKLGILYTDAKKYPEAISIFKDLLTAAPQSDKILYYLGAIHQEMNQFDQSIEYFNQIPSSSGLYTDSSVQMANMLSSLALAEVTNQNEKFQTQKFLKFVNTKIEEFKDMRVEFSVIKAGYFEGTGQYKLAMETMMTVEDEKNFSTQHKYYLANLYEKEMKYAESTALVMSIIEKEPKNAHAWNFLGYSMLVRGDDLAKAYEYIQTAFKLNPNDGYIRDSLGWYYYKKGETSKALSELQVALKKVPDDIEILKHLAIIYKDLKDFKKARKYLESALRHVRYQSDRLEIIGQIEQLEKDRIPASAKRE